MLIEHHQGQEEEGAKNQRSTDFLSPPPFDMQTLEVKVEAKPPPTPHRHKIACDNSPGRGSAERTLLWKEAQLKVGQLEEEVETNGSEETGKQFPSFA